MRAQSVLCSVFCTAVHSVLTQNHLSSLPLEIFLKINSSSARLLTVSPIHCHTLHAFSQCHQYTVTLCTPSRSVANTLSHSARLLAVSPIHCHTLHAFSQCRQYTVTLCTPSRSVANTLSHSARLLAVSSIHCVANTLSRQYIVS